MGESITLATLIDYMLGIVLDTGSLCINAIRNILLQVSSIIASSALAIYRIAMVQQTGDLL